MKTMKSFVKETLTRLKPELVKQWGVHDLGLFGSVVRGEETNESDIDILVSFDKPIDFFDICRIEDHLEASLNRSVDLALKDTLKPEISKRIFAELELV